MNGFKKLTPKEISGNVIEKISKEWMLIAAEKEGRVNMMTASWGGMGVLWNKPVTFTFFRPQRYTLEFINAADTFSQTFFEESHRGKLNFCGSNSGRDVDKIKECELEVLHDNETPFFAEADLVLICKKLYVQRFDPSCFVDPKINTTHYPHDDHHYMFVSEILNVLEKNDK